MLHKIKSLPILAPKSEERKVPLPIRTHVQLLYQIDLLDKLIDLMIKEANE